MLPKTTLSMFRSAVAGFLWSLLGCCWLFLAGFGVRWVGFVGGCKHGLLVFAGTRSEDLADREGSCVIGAVELVFEGVRWC